MVTQTPEIARIRIETPEDFLDKLKIELTFQEKAELSRDFIPFEISHSEALEAQERINRQTHEKVETLKQLAQASKEAKEQSEEGRAELKSEHREDSLISNIGTKARETGEKIMGKALETSGFKATYEKYKHIAKPLMWMAGLGLTLKLGWTKLKNSFLGIFGKKDQLADEIKQLEMEREFLTDPDAALKKYGTEAQKTVQEKAGETLAGIKEKSSEILDKTAPVAVLGGLGASVFATMRHLLPESMKGTGSMSGMPLLRNFAGRKALKYLGFGGFALAGLGTVAVALQDEPEKFADLGNIPEEPEAQKAWWKKVCDRCGVAGGDMLDLILGKKLDEKLKQKEVPEGYVRLEDHPATSALKHRATEIRIMLEKMMKGGGREAAEMGSILLILKSPAAVASGALGGMKLAAVGLTSPMLLLLGLVGVTGAGQGIAALKNLTIPSSLETPENFTQYLTELLHIPEISDHVASYFPEGASEKIDTACQEAGELLASPDKMQQALEDAYNKIKNLPGAAVEIVRETEQEAIRKTQSDMLGLLRLELEGLDSEKYQDLITLLHQAESKQTPELLDQVQQKCRENGIIIGPSEEFGDTAYEYHIEQAGSVVAAGVFMINPHASIDEQYRVSQRIVTADNFLVGAGQLLAKNTKEAFSGLIDSFKSSPEEGANALSNFINQGGLIGGAIGGATLVLKQGLKTVTIPWKLAEASLESLTGQDGTLEYQEAIASYAGGLVPMFVISSATQGNGEKNIFKKWGKKILWTATYPFQVCKLALNLVKTPISIGTKIYHAGDFLSTRRHDLASIVTDPLSMIKNGIHANILQSLPFKEQKKIGVLREIRNTIEKARYKNDMHRDPGDILEKLRKKLENSNFHHGALDVFNHLSIDDLTQDGLFGTHGKYTAFMRAIDGYSDELVRTHGTEIRKVLTKSFEKNLTKNNIDARSFFDTTIADERMRLENGANKISGEISSIQTSVNQRIATRNQLMTDLSEGIINETQYQTELKNLTREIAELGSKRALLTKLSTGIRLHLHPTEKLKVHGKRAGFLALGAAAVMAMINTAYKTGEVPKDLEEIISESGEDIPESEKTTSDIEYDFTKETVKAKIADMHVYGDLEAIIAGQSGDDPKNMIESLADNHQTSLNTIWNMLSDPTEREVLTNILHEKGEEIMLTPFCSLKMIEGEPSLSFLDRAGFVKNIWEDVEGSEVFEGLIEKPKGAAGVALQVADVGSYMVPFAGTGRDGYDAYEAFSRGNIRDGIWSSAWCGVGLASDILIVGGLVTFGASAAVGAGIKGVRAIAQGARVANAVHDGVTAYKTSRATAKIALEAARAGHGLANLSAMQKAVVMMEKYGTAKTYLTASAVQSIGDWAGKLRNTTTKIKDIPLRSTTAPSGRDRQLG